MDPTLPKKKSIMKDVQKVNQCDNLFRSYVDCVIHNSNDFPKERCGFLESSLKRDCNLPPKWFSQRELLNEKKSNE